MSQTETSKPTSRELWARGDWSELIRLTVEGDAAPGLALDDALYVAAAHLQCGSERDGLKLIQETADLPIAHAINLGSSCKSVGENGHETAGKPYWKRVSGV